jgi:hypothetical protein
LVAASVRLDFGLAIDLNGVTVVAPVLAAAFHHQISAQDEDQEQPYASANYKKHISQQKTGQLAQ